jgi:hypothetical protein
MNFGLVIWLASFAEIERDLISSRTEEMLAAAKERPEVRKIEGQRQIQLGSIPTRN